MDVVVIELVMPVCPLVKPSEQSLDLAPDCEVGVRENAFRTTVEVNACVATRGRNKGKTVTVCPGTVGGVDERSSRDISDDGCPPLVTPTVRFIGDRCIQVADSACLHEPQMRRAGSRTQECRRRMNGQNLQRAQAVRVEESSQTRPMAVELTEGVVGVGQELADRIFVCETLTTVEDEDHRHTPASDLGQGLGCLDRLRIVGCHPDDQIGTASRLESQSAVLLAVLRPDARRIDDDDVAPTCEGHLHNRPGRSLGTIADRRDVGVGEIAEQCALPGLGATEQDDAERSVGFGQRASVADQQVGNLTKVRVGLAGGIIAGRNVPLSAAQRHVVEEPRHLQAHLGEHLGRHALSVQNAEQSLGHAHRACVSRINHQLVPFVVPAPAQPYPPILAPSHTRRASTELPGGRVTSCGVWSSPVSGDGGSPTPNFGALTIPEVEWSASNELAFAFRDAFPVSPGHTLVVTRRTVRSWWDASRYEQLAILDLVDQVKSRLDAELSPDGYNVGFNAGEASGQTIPHLHVHVIPRFNGDMDDPRGGVRHVIPERGNYLDRSPSAMTGAPSLVTPTDRRMLTELFRCLIREDLDRIDLLVSFVMWSGIQHIGRHLDEALERGAHVRLLTTDYLQVTDTRSLGFFLDRLTDGPVGKLEARVFSDPSTSFHPKAYIFTSSATRDGVAFVGSSNLSHSGIASGVEWNIQTTGTRKLVEEFNQLWNDDRSVQLDQDWLTEYERSRQLRRTEEPANPAEAPIADIVEEDEPPARPWSVQAEAMSALEATRLEGHQAGLVVMATGLGKTWLAAFDSTRPEFRRVLFVAHREEILTQARDVYRQIRPGGRLTLFTGGEREPDGDVVFASVQSLHRNLSQFDAERFDYIVVDEFHHAAADTYRRVLAHFRPKFMLGLTATPNRSDNADLLALCSDNLVYDCGLVEGVRRQLLSPFRYRAIPDVADYEHIPWRNGRFDAEELTRQIATQERAAQVFDEWRGLGGEDRRTIGFCCTIAHADFMAEYFRAQGVSAVSVHSGPSSSPRAEALERLATGMLPVVFAVDLFNEGVDVPAIDLVMMLRPTESSIVFLQQLGRGLRRVDGKEHLEVVDLVGNHRGFLLKARLLAKLAGHGNLTDREAVALLAEGDQTLTESLPEGCSITVDPEVVDLLTELIGPASHQDRTVELIREWIDEHGRRPTALELAVHSGQAFKLKQQGGWFALLNDLGLLTVDEQRVFESLRDFLIWIEYGSYTKSYKLITLQAVLQHDGLRRAVPLSEIAATSRWLIYRDVDLVADTADAGSAFEDLTRPTVSEWEVYWRKNPINAITTPTRGEDPWFEVSDGNLRARVPDETDLDDTINSLVSEIVEYRLYRYLASQRTRRIGEVRKPIENGREVDATFVVETTGVTPTSVVIESAGGTAGSEGARNTEYVRGFDLVLSRLAGLGAQLLDCYIDTRTTANLTVADRRLHPGDGLTYPVPLAAGVNLLNMRKSLLRSMSRAGRTSASKGGGNARKRCRLVVAVPTRWTASDLADALSSGHAISALSAARSRGEP